jgi:hypothetical protein
VAVQDLDTNNSLLERQRQIFRASLERLAFLEQRRYKIPQEGAIPALQLGQLLDVQSQLADSKSSFAEALANRQRSEFELNRASGILVQAGDGYLGHPGSNSCFVVFRQYIEGDRHYRDYAKQTAHEIANVARRGRATWRENNISPRRNATLGFGYPHSVSATSAVQSPWRSVDESLIETASPVNGTHYESGMVYEMAFGRDSSTPQRAIEQRQTVVSAHNRDRKLLQQAKLRNPKADQLSVRAQPAQRFSMPRQSARSRRLSQSRQLPNSSVSQKKLSDAKPIQTRGSIMNAGGVVQASFQEPVVSHDARHRSQIPANQFGYPLRSATQNR